MAKEALNKVRYKQFAQKCRGARVGNVTINRTETKKQTLYRYNAKALKGGKRFTAEWVVVRGERTDEDMKKLETDFLERVRADFIISKVGFGASAAPTETADAEAGAS